MQAGHRAVTSHFAQAQNQMGRLGSALEQFRQSYQDPLAELEQLRRAHVAYAAEARTAAKTIPATALPTSTPAAKSAQAKPEE
jgi:hypothetical protein